MQVYINLKSGNPVTIIPGSESTTKWTKTMKPVPCVTVKRIDCDKELLVLPSSLLKVEDFLAQGGELSTTSLNLIKSLQS